MEYTTKSKNGNSITLSATFNADEVAVMRREAMLGMARKLKIPGFRPGKAPLSILANYIDNEEIKDDILQKGASEAYVSFLKDHKDTEALIFEPEIVDSSLEGDGDKSTLTVDVRVFEMPRADREMWSSIEVEDAPIDTTRAVQRRISALVDAVTETVPKEGPAASGDEVSVSIATQKSESPYHTEFTLGEGEVGKAYEPFVAGMNVGESRHFNVQLKEESSLEGEVTLESVAEKHVPEVNDDFARTVGAFESLEELRKTLEQDEWRKADEARKEAIFDRSINAAAEKLGIDFPGYVRRDATQERLDEIKESLTRNGLSLSEYLKYNNIDMEQLTKDVEADAVKLLQRDLLIEATERSCGVVAEDSDIDAYIEAHRDELAKAGIDPSTEKGRKTVRNVVEWEKTRTLILESVVLKAADQAKQEE
jgi:trigger factor